MYNMFQQLRLFAYNQLLSKKVSSTKLDEAEDKEIPQNSKNCFLQEISANLKESERNLLEKSTISCRENKSKSDTDIKDSTKTVLNTAKKILSLSDLKSHIACMNIKKFTRTQKQDIMKPNIICSSGDSEIKFESIKSRHQRRHKHVVTNESPSSCNIFGFYKNRRRKHISPYEVYIQSVKPVLSINYNKLKKCGSKVIRHERRAKHIPDPSSHHALKVITSNHAKNKVAGEYEDDELDSLKCFKNQGELSYSLSIPRQDHKRKQVLPLKNESIMCHITENRKHMHGAYEKHQPKKNLRVSYSIPKDHSVDGACSNVPADQTLRLPILTTENLPPKYEFGCSPVPCVPKCECMLKVSQSMIEEIDNATQTTTCKHPHRTRPFSCFLPKPYKKSVQYVANLHINKPDPKSIVKCILICLVVTVWSPILLAIGIGWLLSYPLRPCIVWQRNLQYEQKKVCTCKYPSSCYKPGQTRLQYIVQAFKLQPSQRQNQKQEPYAWRTLSSCRRRDLGKNYCVFHSDCRTNPLHTSQHRTNTITNFFHRVFCSCDKIHQSNLSSFRARRNMVALKNNSLKEPTLTDKCTNHPIVEFSPRPLQHSETIKIYPIHDIGTTTEPKIKSANLQTHYDQGKSDDEIKWSSFFSPFMKLVKNYIVHSKFTTEFLKKSTHPRGLDPERQCFQRPATNFSKNLRGQSSCVHGPNKIMESRPFSSLVSKETKKYDYKQQKVMDFADKVFQNRESSKLRNKNTKTDSINQQNKTKKLFWEVSQTTHETATNFDKSTQKPVGSRKHKALHSSRCQSPHNEGTKCLQLASTHYKSPDCDKTLKGNTTIDLDFPLSAPTKSPSTHSFTAYERHTESLGHRTKEVNNTTEIKKIENPDSSNNVLPSVLSEQKKQPFVDNFAVYKYPVSGHTECICDTKKANVAVGTDQISNTCGSKHVQCSIKLDRSSFFKCPISGDTKCSCSKWYEINKTNISIGSDQKQQPCDSCYKQIHKLKQGHSSTSKYPSSSDVECSCGLKRKEANVTLRMKQKSKSNSFCQCRLIQSPNVGPAACSCDCKCPISENTKNYHKMKNTKAAVEKDQKSNSNSNCQCHLIKPIKLPAARSVVCKCPKCKNSENLRQSMKKANTAVETDKKSKSNTSCQCHLLKPTQLPPDGCSVVSKCPQCINSENLSHKTKKAKAAAETDKKSKSNTSCQCQLIKPTNSAPADSSSCKCPISESTDSKRNEANAYVRMNRNANPGPDLKNHKPHKRPSSPKIYKISKYLKGKKKISTSCHCHLLNPTQLSPDGSICECPNIAKTESLCHNCYKKKQANKVVKTEQYSELSSSCDCQRSKYCDPSHDDLQEENAAIGTDPKSKVSCERANNVLYDFVHTPFQSDALNVYKLCPISGDTDSIKKKIKRKKYRNDKIVTKKCIHSPEYLNVCSEVCGSLREKNCIAHSLSNNYKKCRMNKQMRIRKKQPNRLKSPYNDNECSKQRVTVRCSMTDCKIGRSNVSESNTDKVAKNWTSRYQNAGNTVKKCCAHKHCKMKKEAQFADKPIQAETKICADKSQSCSCAHSELTKLSNEEKKSCSSQTFKKATFATPYSEQPCKKRKPMRTKCLAHNFFDLIVGRNRKTIQKCNKEPFETIQPSGILIKTSDDKRQNYEKESQQCYGGSTERKSRNINTALSQINTNNKICHSITEGRKNYNSKSMDFSYFTILKDLIDSKTLQNRNAQYNKTNIQQSKKNSPCNKMLQMQKQYPCVASVGQVVAPRVSCACVSPRISSVRPLEHSVITECKYPIQIQDTEPSFPISCSCERGVSVIKKHQKPLSPHNLNNKETNQLQDNSPQINQKLNATRSTNTPNTSNPRLSSKRSTNIQQKIAKLHSSIIAKRSKHKLSSQPGLKISKNNEYKPQLDSNMLEVKEQKLSLQINSNIPETKKAIKKAKLSRDLISGKGDDSSNRHGYRTQVMVTGKGDNSLNFNDKRDLIKMCFKRKVNLTPSLVKCLSDSFNLVSTQRKHLPRIIDHIKYDKYSKTNKRDRIKVEYTGNSKISKATGIEQECACTQIKKRPRHHNVKNQNTKRMGDADRRHKRKIRKNKPHSSKIHHRKNRERKSFWVQHNPDKKAIIKKKVNKKIVKKKESSRSVKSSRKQISSYSGGGDELQCSDLYLATLRKRPWFWVYRLLPKCYPNFLRFRLCSKTICTQCAFSLTCCLWAPVVVICLICYELFSCCQ